MIGVIYPGSGFFSIPDPWSEIRISYPRAKKAMDIGSATWWWKQMSVLNLSEYCSLSSKKFSEIWPGMYGISGSGFFSFHLARIRDSDLVSKGQKSTGSWIRNLMMEANISFFHISQYCSLPSKTFKKLWEIWSGLYLTGSGFFPSPIPDLDLGSQGQKSTGFCIRNLMMEANMSSLNIALYPSGWAGWREASPRYRCGARIMTPRRNDFRYRLVPTTYFRV